ncbi:Coiled-coil domain-containing protein [Cladobotryum mycophilum]|uniref:Coiled-coil domain-containing protein n=1 Tax=Cladobotryum mycophilum TaxID=491253 RepID=A0ABR0S6M5_9HYPO
MPFPIWCGTCPKPTVIGQGVRFNAEKKREGSYYTTPVWGFRFKHAACGGWIEMRTDPKNTAYVVVEGAKKRDTGEDKARDGDTVILTDGEREALRQNAFGSLEKTIEDREALALATERIDDLLDVSSRQWDDPYAQNQRLRRAFRVGRKEREKLAAATEELKDRMSLGMDILPETEEDARRAALVDFGALDETDSTDRALSKPLFASKKPTTTQSSSSSSKAKTTAPKLKSEKQASKRKENLVSKLMSNTRAAQDPFLINSRTGTDDKLSAKLLPGVKRKRADNNDNDNDTNNTNTNTPTPPPIAKRQDQPPAKVSAQEKSVPGALVAYDSDDE